MASSRPRDGLGQFDEHDQLPLKCMFCCAEKRLQTFHDVKEGDHIKQQGEQGSFNLSKKLVKFYSHHAIIKEVHDVTENGCSAIITLIEFMSSSFDPTVKIQERTVLKNLCYDEIYLIKYQHKTHPPAEIIRRGLKLMNEDLRYNLLFRNCEHVARWCVCGNDTSFQAEGAFEQINMVCRYVYDNIRLKLVAMTVDDFLVIKDLPVLRSVALVAVILQQLISCKTDTNVLSKLQESGGICESCCKKRKRELWAKFAVLLLLQTGGLVATSRIERFGLQFLFGIFMSLLTTQVMRVIPKFYKDISSPFVGRKVHINSFDRIRVGDVISWKTYGFFNDGIVTGISILPNSDNKIADLNVIHYKLPGLFAKGIVVEETIHLNIKSNQVRFHEYPEDDCNLPEIVLKRGRERLGEEKFRLTNKSAQFCHWAKMKDAKDNETDADCSQAGTLKYLRPLDEKENDLHLQPLEIDHRRTRPFIDIIPIAINRPFASKEITKEKVRIRDDIKPGQLIQFTFNHFPHQAVCTAVRGGNKPSDVVLDAIHYGTSRRVSEETFNFDLNKDDIEVVKIHPIYKFSKNDIIRRAKAKLGQGGYNMLTHRSSHLAEEIIYKDIDRRVCSFSEVKPGDCINYKYKKMPHDAVVVNVKPLPTKANEKGYITVVHYAVDDWKLLFGTRYIKKEEVFFNLLEQSVVVKSFPGKVVYPDEVVVQRAFSREGEQKLHIFGNISSDFVYWAKVVQTPCVVTITPADASISEGDKKFLLLPRVGKSEEMHIQKDWIKTWDEVILGIIVEKDGIIGIVTEVHTAEREIKVIHNEIIGNAGNAHNRPEISIGRITEKTVKVDLSKEFLNIYRCDPRFANGSSVCVRKARELLGQKVPGVNGLGFCKNCALK